MPKCVDKVAKQLASFSTSIQVVFQKIIMMNGLIENDVMFQDMLCRFERATLFQFLDL